MINQETLPVTFADVKAAAEVIANVANRTPVITSRSVDAHLGAEVFFKCENFQRTGSFKFRGAYNALSRLGPEEGRRGVLTYSSGNHGQAVALAGQLLGIPAVIVMPEDAPEIKRRATDGYGGEIIFYDRHSQVREEIGERLARERGLTIIPPYNHPHVIAGQGTAALELIEEVGRLDAVIVSVGGGGVISGWALATKGLCPQAKVYGAEPLQASDAARSLKSGVLHSNINPQTIADGARTTSLGSLTFPIVRELVDDIFLIQEEEIMAALRFLWERIKTVAEPTGALAPAALFQKPELFKGKRVGVLITGGNVDVTRIAKLL